MSRSEVILLQFDIAGHSKLKVPDKNLQIARKTLQKYISALVSVQRDTKVSWAGDGGWCWFAVKQSEDFSTATDAAVDILNILPRINEMLLRDKIVPNPLAIRLSADSMNIELDDDPTHFAAPMMNKFLKYERDIGLVNSLVITERIFSQLQFSSQERFDLWKYSSELETKLYVYDGIKSRNTILEGLKSRGENPQDLSAEFIKVTTFQQDRYTKICCHAYADLVLDIDLLNVESVRFVTFRNALANTVIRFVMPLDIPELSNLEEEEKIKTIAAFPYEFLQHEGAYHYRHSFQGHFPENQRSQSENIDPLAEALKWCDSEFALMGGESLYFFNTSALGFIAEIGESTLLDHVCAGTIKILSVTGGVQEPQIMDNN